MFLSSSLSWSKDDSRDDLVKRDKLMKPRINELSNLMSKSEDLADIQDFIELGSDEITPFEVPVSLRCLTNALVSIP